MVDQEELKERKSAAAPATWGAAIEVPESMHVPPPKQVDSIFTPGAASSISGPIAAKFARLLLMSVAVTAITVFKLAGYVTAPPDVLPAAATRTISALWLAALRSSGCE